MAKIKNLPIKFDGFQIRKIYNEEKEKWFFSVIDIVAVLLEQVDFKKAQSWQ